MTDAAVTPFAPPATDAADATDELVGSIRDLVDACVRSQVGGEEMAAVATQVRALTDRLLTRAETGPLGAATLDSGALSDAGNPMVGHRNPIAPPLEITGDAQGTMRATFTFGAAYEGPPGCLHGGWVAAVLDQVVGTAPFQIGKWGMTAYLNTTYRRPTRLGVEHVVDARIDRVEGWKVFASGEIRDPDGEVTAEAEALFVVPRWARDRPGGPVGWATRSVPTP